MAVWVVAGSLWHFRVRLNGTQQGGKMKYNLAFIGFGTVGQRLANLLSGALI
jgi:hypothetical protein